jgi:hypothetical protein
MFRIPIHLISVPSVFVVVACMKGPDRAATDHAPAAPSSTASAASTPARTGCSYLSEAQASAALGQPSRYRLRQPTPAGCTIEPASGDVFHGTTVDFRVAPGTAQYDFLAAQKDADKITGLGDRAVWLGAGRTRGNLAVVRGNTAVLVTITDLSGHRQLEQKARDFARLVLEHL